MQDFAEGLRVSPVNYFEAKPQRTVDLSEFAGAVVPRGTAPEIISLLESKGLKVRDYDRFAKEAPFKTNQDRLDQRNTFTDQLFDLLAPRSLEVLPLPLPLHQQLGFVKP